MIKTDRYLIDITPAPLNLAEMYNFVIGATNGAVDIFVGTVRNFAEGKDVEALEYHGYPEMGERVLQRMIEQAFEKWNIGRIAVQHRLGRLQLTEASVIIAVSAPHRAEAFEACRFIIEEIKKDLPIWKKEYFVDGEHHWKNDPATKSG